jgi:NAD(P)-dependent dehydrogenase (short-subunit alcohol dehydrogenase family)
VIESGRVALIAGASNPMTRPIAVVLGERGVDVALSTSVNGDAATFAMNSIANELWALDRRHLAIPAEVQPEDAVRLTIEELGRLDFLLTLPESNASNDGKGVLIRDYLLDRLGNVLLLCDAASSAMSDGEGTILNCFVRGDSATQPAEAAAEAGVEAASLALARRLQARISVNAALINASTDSRQIAALGAELLTSHVSGQVFTL